MRRIHLLVILFVQASGFPLCGNATLPLMRKSLNVLLIGDSISMTPPYTPGGYGGALEKLLSAKGVHAQHAGGEFTGGQAGDTRLGMVCTNTTGAGYLNVSGVFDLIHFNYGLHDLANYGPSAPPLALPQYGENLAAIYKRLQTKARLVMWTSTTPVANVPQPYNRTYDAAVEYNAQALASLTEANDGKAPLMNDLWRAFIEHCGERYKSCDLQLPSNVHLTPAGIAFAAESAASDILRALGL